MNIKIALISLFVYCLAVSDFANAQVSSKFKWEEIVDADYIINKENNLSKVIIFPVKSEQYIKVISDAENLWFSISNGSGIFQDAGLVASDQNSSIFHNKSSSVVWLKVNYSKRSTIEIYQSKKQHYSPFDLMLNLSLKVSETDSNHRSFQLSDNKNRVERIAINPNYSYSLQMDKPGVLLFRHQVDYQMVKGEFDVLYQVGWTVDGKENYRNYTSRPEMARLYQDACFNQLGISKNTFIKVEKAGHYRFHSNKPIVASFYAISDEQFLFAKNSELPIEFEQEIEQLEQANVIVNNFNVFIDAGFYQKALSTLGDKQKSEEIFDLIRSKHSYFKPLHPKTLDQQKMLFGYYSIYSEPEFADSNRKVYLNESLTDSLTNKLSVGYFYDLGKRKSLNYNLPKQMFESRLRLAITNIAEDEEPISITFNTGEKLLLSTEASFKDLSKRLNFVDIALIIMNPVQDGQLATLSKEFSNKRPAAPFVNSVTGLIDIPKGASSFTINSSNSDIWASVAYPHRTYSRPFEYQIIEQAETKDFAFSRLERFIRSYKKYKELKLGAYSFEQLQGKLTELDDQLLTDLQDWTPYYSEIYHLDSVLPQQKNSQIKLFNLEKIKGINQALEQTGQRRLRKDTLQSHIYYSPDKAVRNYAFDLYIKSITDDEKYGLGLSTGLLALVRNGDDYTIEELSKLYQKLGDHKRALFYASLLPNYIDQDMLLASLFNLRQWDLFDKLKQKSVRRIVWSNLQQFYKTQNLEFLTEKELGLITELGESWAPENRFILNYQRSKILQNVSTLANKQLSVLSPTESAKLVVKGPAKLRLRLAKEFKDSRYYNSKHGLIIKSETQKTKFLFKSKPSSRWVTSDESVVGSFGKVEIEVPAGIHQYHLTSPDGNAYFYVENKKNILGLNLVGEETVDAQFVREHGLLYKGVDANEKRLVGFIKSGCEGLSPLIQKPLKTFRPVDIDLMAREQWLKNRFSESSTKPLELTSYSSCDDNRASAESCIQHWYPSMQKGNLDSAINILSHIDRYKLTDLATYRPDVFEKFEWAKIAHVAQSDGSISLRSHQAQEDNQYLNILQNEFSNKNLSSLYLTANRVQGFEFDLTRKKHQFIFTRFSQNPLIIKPMSINYRIANGAVQKIAMLDDLVTIDLNLKNNQRLVKFWLPEEYADEYISITHSNTDLMMQSKEYHVATMDTPVKLQIKGPQRLKVVAQDKNGTRKVYEKQVAAGVQELSFIANGEETYYRFFKLQPRFGVKKLKMVYFDEETKNLLDWNRKKEIQRASHSNFDWLNVENKISEIYNTDNQIHDFSIIYGNSLDDEQENFDQPRNNYIAVDGNYRYRATDSNIIYSGDGQLRVADNYQALWGSFRADWLPVQTPWQYFVKANNWYFSGDDINFDALQLGVGGSYRFNYNQRHSFATSFSGFYRQLLGKDFSNAAFVNVPSEIWSNYKSSHQFGVDIAQNWNFNILRDGQVFSTFKLRTNQELTTIDYYQLSAGYRQLYDTLAFEATYYNRGYLADDDRVDSYSSNRFKLSVDWLFKSNAEQAFKLNFNYFKNFDTNSDTYLLGLTWLLHKGNYLEKYRGGEHHFRGLRSLRMHEETFERLIESESIEQ